MPEATVIPVYNGAANRVDTDRGPRYTETPRDPAAPDAPVPAEPWNTVTASFFIVLVLAWIVRLRGRFRQFPFMAACLPILAVGAVAGTLYHGTRTRNIYFVLDWVPISLLGLAAAIYLVVKLGRAKGMTSVRAMLLAMGVVVVYAILNRLVFTFIPLDPPTLRISASYGSMALLILVPLLGTLMITRFRHAWLVWAGLAGFGIAIACRMVDPYSPLPMGTHWLWHTFGCFATALLFEYFYRLEKGEPPSGNGQGRPIGGPPGNDVA
jgi:hypothetical protein